MRAGIRLAAALLTVLVAGPAQASDSDDVVATITDERIPESSALVQSTRDPNLAYTVNDSGDGPYVYVLELASGDVVGVTTLDGIEVDDVEALALGADERLYVADVGDNNEDRSNLAVHALEQPGRGAVTAPVQTYPIAHRGGPVDVETLLIDPTDGRTYLVTKDLLGGEVLRLPELRTDAPVSSVPVADVDVPAVVTDGVWLPDGTGVVLRTYVGAVVYAMPGWDEVGEVELPVQPQGESLAVAGGGPGLYVGTEGVPSPIQRVSIPAEVWRTLHAASVTAADSPAAPRVASSAGGDADAGSGPVAIVLSSTGLLAVLGGLWLVVHRRRRR